MWMDVEWRRLPGELDDLNGNSVKSKKIKVLGEDDGDDERRGEDF